ncbi:oligosaccharide flippase family protein [Confluentibacter citreus]|uniref:oligosaccharide flippase family protein n=1 Tax=Confluentibacter citreus TaxID=2007307 RepID=UPI000C29154C|nr:oligosaccharide flippase family protein [Confluentibacter citreus]
MEADKDSYRQIIKTTSLFGGVQIFSILISLAKSKVAALLIGVSGMGVFGILTSTLNIILTLTRCGLDISAVKEIASVNNNPEKDKLPKIVTATIQFTWITGIIAAMIVLIMSPWLSLIAFGNKNYSLFFVIISIAILFNQLTIGNLAVLQGLKSLKELAKITVLASFFSLMPTTIIYYLIGEKGIPWVISITAIIGFLLSKYYINKLEIKKVNLPINELISSSKNLIRLGFVLSLASLTSHFVVYAIQIFITKEGGINEVGLYNSGIMLIHSYVAIFFNAISKDFFPRLAEVSKDNTLIKKMVNQQASMSILLLTPLIIIFLVFRPFIVTLIYSKEFLPILGMITYGVLSILFKAASWPMGFVIIAKGNSKLYFVTELISNVILFISVVIGYDLYGLTGLGLGYLIYHILDFLIVKFVVFIKYQFLFDVKFNKLFLICVFQCLAMIYLLQIEYLALKFSLMTILASFSIIFAIIKLNGYVGLKDFLKNILKK